LAGGDIWVSSVLNDSRLVKPFKPEGMEPAWKQFWDNGVVDTELLPLKLYANYRDQPTPKMPDFFTGGAGLQFSAAVANVLSRFDLDRYAPIPIVLFKHDKISQFPGSYFVIRLAEKKDTIVAEECGGTPEECTAIKEQRGSYPKHWRMPLVPKDGNIAVKSSVVGGVDFLDGP
jgi:hypothetical protein